LCSVGKYKPTLSATPLKLSLCFQANNLSESRYRDVELIILLSAEERLQECLFAEWQFNLQLSNELGLI